MEFKEYLLKVVEITNKAITFIITHWISRQILLRSFLLILGIMPLLYCIGYIILYGLYFGGAKSSILSLTLQYVPFNRFACISVGLLFTGFTAFIWWIYVLLRDRKKFKYKWSLIVFIISIFMVMMQGHLLLFFVTQDFLNLNHFMKFSLIWLGPVAVIIIWKIMKVVHDLYGLVLVSLGIMIFLHSLLTNEVTGETFYLFLIIGTGSMTALLKKYHTNRFGIIWFFTFIFTVMIISIAVIINGVEFDRIRWLFILLSLSFSFLFARIIEFLLKRREERMQINQGTMKLRFNNILDTGIYYWSVIILLIVPLTIFLIFSTGSYIGETLRMYNIYTSGTVTINEQIIQGDVISNDNEYMYVSTPQRTLLILHPGSQVIIVK